jgi:hypothetical protein
MRKRIIDSVPMKVTTEEYDWLDLAQLATVEVTSETAAQPIEAALLDETEAGWQAAQPGEQCIRLLFDQPQRLRRIKLLFVEHEKARTQAYVLRWARDAAGPAQEILRQQYNFSPPETVREAELHTVELAGVELLELSITPDIQGGTACASLAYLRLA